MPLLWKNDQLGPKQLSCLNIPSHYINFRYWPKFLKADNFIWLALTSIYYHRNTECFHFCDPWASFTNTNKTKESLCIRIYFNSCRISSGHQQGCRSFVQGHQHCCHEVTSKHALSFDISKQMISANHASSNWPLADKFWKMVSNLGHYPGCSSAYPNRNWLLFHF